MTHCIYKHTFPDGKIYIGQTTSGNTAKRWRNGHGYKGQGKVFSAIIKYGWDNITHEIIVDGIPDRAINDYEALFIYEYNSHVEGYNTRSELYSDLFARTGNHTGKMLASAFYANDERRFKELMNKTPEKDNPWQIHQFERGRWGDIIQTLVTEALLAADKSYRDIYGHSLVFDMCTKKDEIKRETIEAFIDVAEWSVSIWLKTDVRHERRVFGWTEDHAYQKLLEI